MPNIWGTPSELFLIRRYLSCLHRKDHSVTTISRGSCDHSRGSCDHCIEILWSFPGDHVTTVLRSCDHSRGSCDHRIEITWSFPGIMWPPYWDHVIIPGDHVTTVLRSCDHSWGSRDHRIEITWSFLGIMWPPYWDHNHSRDHVTTILRSQSFPGSCDYCIEITWSFLGIMWPPYWDHMIIPGDHVTTYLQITITMKPIPSRTNPMLLHKLLKALWKEKQHQPNFPSFHYEVKVSTKWRKYMETNVLCLHIKILHVFSPFCAHPPLHHNG